jgi:type VI secretion system protein ImpH
MTALPPSPLENSDVSPGMPEQATSDTISTSLFWRQLVEHPYKADLFAVLRWVDSRKKQGPLLGRAARPHFDAIRLGQEPALTFAASTIANVSAGSEDLPPRLNNYSFGLFGPNGPLPLHLTEYARDRLRRFNDPTLVRFADIFHHRLILLFYRAWADAQPTASMDRADTDRFTNYIGSLIGFGQPAMRSRDAIADHAKFFHAAHLVRQTRNPEGLVKILREFLQIPVAIEEFIPYWLTISQPDQTRLSRHMGNNCLGKDTFIGARMLDAQHKIRLRLGPMSLARYQELLPGGSAIKQVATWVRNYVGIEFLVDIQLVLRKEETPQARLGDTCRLGWTGWLGERDCQDDADPLVIECHI